MKDPSRTKQELIEEITALTQRTQELEKAEADSKRDRESVRVYDERYRLLVNNMPDIIYSLDGEGNVVTVNSSAFERYGYTEQDSKGKPFIDFIHPDDREIVIGSFLKAIEEHRNVTTGLQFRIVAENDISCWFELNSHARFDSLGRYIGEDGVLRDITERKFRENEGELKARLNELVYMPGDFRKLLSELTASLQGWSGCEAVGIRLRAGDDYPFYETRGFPPAFVQAENHLCAYSTDGKIIRDGAGNPVLDCMCGNILCGRFDPAKPFFTAKGSFWSNTTTSLLASTAEADRLVRTRNRCNGEGYESVALIPLRTGDQVFGLLQFNDHRPDRFTPGLIDHFERMADSMAIALSRRQDEEALREINERLSMALEVGNAGLWEWDIRRDEVRFDPWFHALLGYSPGELPTTAQEWKTYHHPEDLSVMISRVEAYLRGDTPLYESEHRIRTKAGTWKWVLTRGRLVNLPPAGAPEKFIGIAIDVTPRKQVEEKIQNSETFLNRLIEQSPTAMWISDDQGNLIRLNQACCDLLKITADEVVGRYNIFQDNIVKDQGLLPLVEAVFERGETAHFEIDYNSSHVEGLKLQHTVAVILDTTIFPIKDTHGRITHAVIQHNNITERKLAEDALRLKNLVFDVSIAANSIADRDGIITDTNDTFLRTWAYQCKDEVVGKPIMYFLNDPEEAAAIVTALNNIGLWEGDYTAKRKDGSTFTAHGMATVIRNENGNVIGYQSAVMDITERMRAEEALKKSEEMLRLISENMSDMIRVTDLRGNNVYVSPSHFKSLGYKPEERLGKTGFDIMHPDDVEMVISKFAEGLTGKQEHIKAEYRARHADGHYLWLETIGDLLRDAHGNAKTVIMSSRDITERKRREHEINELSLTNQRILNSAGEGIYGLDLYSNITFINVAAAEMLGWEVKEIIGKNSHQLWHHTKTDGTSYPEVACGLKEILKSGVGKKDIEDWFWKKDGNCFPVEYVNNPIYEKESLIGAVVTFRDITERKLANEKLKKALGATVQAIASVVETRDPYTAGHQRRVAGLAAAIATDMGLAPDQIDGLRMASIIHDIGKISVPGEILTKPTQLSDIEFRLIQTHAQSGYDILKDIEFPWPIARIVLEHHERIDGSGYPHGTTGEEVLVESKILAVADVVEALASDRPYRPGRGMAIALEEIGKNKGRAYDDIVVDVCLRLFQEKGFQLEIIHD